jgi:NAD(P)-dependent dehydrogenase (short-subunit alcohol dehydrogenase family)
LRNLDGGAEIRRVAEEEKLPIHLAALDVDDDASVREAFARVVAQLGPIDVLVNNAGVPGGGPVEETTLDQFRQVMENQLLRRSSVHQGGDPKHARAAQGNHRQHHLDCGPLG